MKSKILITILIIVIILFIGISSAGEIKGIKKELGLNNNILLTVTTDNTVTSISDNDHPLIGESSNGVIHWTRSIDYNEDNGISKIKASSGTALHVNGGQDDSSGNGGCLNRNGYNSHNIPYSLAHVDLNNNNLITTYYLDTEDDGNHPDSGIIGICIYPSPYNNPSLNLLYDSALWEIKHNSDWDYFGFGRIQGNNKIPLGIDTDIGAATYTNNIPTEQNILLHIYDPIECGRYSEGQTCWRRPGTSTQIPEFPTIALPIAAMIGLVFFFQQRKK